MTFTKKYNDLLKKLLNRIIELISAQIVSLEKQLTSIKIELSGLKTLVLKNPNNSEIKQKLEKETKTRAGPLVQQLADLEKNITFVSSLIGKLDSESESELTETDIQFCQMLILNFHLNDSFCLNDSQPVGLIKKFQSILDNLSKIVKTVKNIYDAAILANKRNCSHLRERYFDGWFDINNPDVRPNKIIRPAQYTSGVNRCGKQYCYRSSFAETRPAADWEIAYVKDELKKFKENAETYENQRIERLKKVEVFSKEFQEFMSNVSMLKEEIRTIYGSSSGFVFLFKEYSEIEIESLTRIFTIFDEFHSKMSEVTSDYDKYNTEISKKKDHLREVGFWVDD